MSMRILGINGSLQMGSNHAILEAARETFSDGEMRIFQELRLVPPFERLDEREEPSAVAALRREVAWANGVLIVTPEYAHSLPGVLKNALDWLVGTGELALKPVAIITTSTTPTGGLRAQVALIQTLLAQSADVVALLPISSSKQKIDPAQNVIHPPILRRVGETLAALIERCHELTEETIITG